MRAIDILMPFSSARSAQSSLGCNGRPGWVAIPLTKDVAGLAGRDWLSWFDPCGQESSRCGEIPTYLDRHYWIGLAAVLNPKTSSVLMDWWFPALVTSSTWQHPEIGLRRNGLPCGMHEVE